MSARVTIRSYRICFKLERRLHRIENWRIPLPYGVPLRGMGYAVVALIAIVILDGIPPASLLLGALHPVLRYGILPIAIAYLMTQWSVDGRAAHHVGLAWVRYRFGPSRLVAFRAQPAPGVVRFGSVTFAPDDTAARMRRGVVHGPARVTLYFPARARQRGRTLYLRQSPGEPLWRGQVVNVRPDQRIVIE